MVTEVVPIEIRISRLESDLKVLRSAHLPESKALMATYEADLKLAREEQRLARPLPARLQAATDKVAKNKQLKEENAAKTAALRAQVEALEKEGRRRSRPRQPRPS